MCTREVTMVVGTSVCVPGRLCWVCTSVCVPGRLCWVWYLLLCTREAMLGVELPAVYQGGYAGYIHPEVRRSTTVGIYTLRLREAQRGAYYLPSSLRNVHNEARTMGYMPRVGPLSCSRFTVGQHFDHRRIINFMSERHVCAP